MRYTLNIRPRTTAQRLGAQRPSALSPTHSATDRLMRQRPICAAEARAVRKEGQTWS